MSDEGTEVQRIDWRRCFQFLEILRSFRMAVHPVNLILCFLGLAASLGVGVGIDAIPGVGETNARLLYEETRDAMVLGRAASFGGWSTAEVLEDGRVSLYENLCHIVRDRIWGDWALPYVGDSTWGDFFGFMMAPLSAARDLILLVVDYWMNAQWFALINTVALLGIWAMVGGAVTRMAAVRVAREESVPMKQALGFACRKWPSTVSSPLIPFGVLVSLAVLMGALTGVFLMIPYLGEWAVGLLLFLPLLMGLVLALIFVGGAFSVGLQWPTIAAEGSDSFDAISRSISYISSRPWKYLFSTVFALVYGCATFILVKFVAFLTLRLTREAVETFSWGWGEAPDKIARVWPVPALSSPWPEAMDLAPEVYSEGAAACVFAFWVYVVLGIMMAFLVSFFFCSQTVIYFLMRRSVDATDIEEVYMEDAEEEELPVEGLGDMDAETPTEGEGEAEGETEPPETEAESEEGASEEGGGDEEEDTDEQA
jgi:hypothetical protein